MILMKYINSLRNPVRQYYCLKVKIFTNNRKGIIMNLDTAIKTRIQEIIENKQCSLTSLSLDANLTPSTLFDFMYGKSKYPQIITIAKVCKGAGITLKEFFNKPYFDNLEDIYK